jgi:glycosyltransferase involved in cell wall biosynthesis
MLLHALDLLDRGQYHPIVLCPRDGALAELVESRGIECVRTGELRARFTKNPLLLALYLFSFLKLIFSTRRHLRQAAPDLVHANTMRTGIMATLATAGTNVPVLWHVQDDLPARHPLSTAIRLLAYLSRRTRVIAVSAATLAAFCGRLNFGERAIVIHNAVDLARFPMRQQCGPEFKRELGLQEEDFLACAVGMINPRKGLLELIDAMHLVADRIPHLHLAMVGEPIFNNDAAYLKALIARVKMYGLDDRIHLTGGRSDVASVLRSIDLLVLNAKVEPFGLVLLEAMSSGTPVLAADAGGIPEIVADGKTGWLVPKNNTAVLAKALLQLSSDRMRTNSVVQSARTEVEKHFALANYRAAISNCYAKIFEKEKPAAKIAIFHDNFAQMGGAERVAEVLHRTYPQADMLSTLTVIERLTEYLQKTKPKNSWMQWLPAKAKLFRYYFLVYPFAVEQTDLSSYDLVISSCFGYAKGVKRKEGAVHVCYCHNPMRWVWRTSDYIAREDFSPWKRALLQLALKPLKAWELRAAKRPDYYIANSRIVADRLQHAFGISAEVIPPPIDTASFSLSDKTGDYYLILSRLTPYKRFDLAVEACTRSGRKLIVIGDGPDRERLQAMAGPTVQFLGRQPDDVVARYASECRALLFPGEEDFGMTPLEINAAGRPVVAFRGGGAVETVVEGLNGVFFNLPSADSLILAMDKLEAMQWDQQAIRAHAQRYDIKVFQSRIREFIANVSPAASRLASPQHSSSSVSVQRREAR